ncbi:MAG: GGDEF domain-containing protein [Clostridia bacterium]|nr:GGDEF domain-containing protein [Clostridia bacterium]
MDLPTVYVINGIGLVILACVIVCNGSFLVRKDKGMLEWRLMILVTAFSFFIDPLMAKLDGNSSENVAAILKAGNSWLFFAGALVPALWLLFVTKRIYGNAKKFGIDYICIAFMAVNFIALAVNYFYPVFFTVDENNVYSRMPLYIIIALAFLIPVVIGIIVFSVSYAKNKKLNITGVLFLFPVIIAYIFQMIFPGQYLVWPAIAVGIMCVTFSMLNEEKFRDSLTGLYNRAYLDYLVSTTLSFRESVYDGIMIDINAFKRINDNYGHAVGDEALRITATVLEKACEPNSIIIRYAGDEFVILMPARHKISPDQTINNINALMEKFCKTANLGFELSLSCGYDVLHAGTEDAEDFMNRIDMAMLESKRAFYEKNPHLERRRR